MIRGQNREGAHPAQMSWFPVSFGGVYSTPRLAWSGDSTSFKRAAEVQTRTQRPPGMMWLYTAQARGAACGTTVQGGRRPSPCLLH